MKTVKRKAEIGERVLIGRVWDLEGKSGTVIRQHETGPGVWVKVGDDEFPIHHDRYEVIIEDEPKDFEEQFKKIAAVTEHSSKRIAEASKRMAEKLSAEAIPPHSSHYHQNGLDPLEVMRRTFPPEQYEGFLRGSLLKYTMRYDRKGQQQADLEKLNFHGRELEQWKTSLKDVNGNVIEAEDYEDA